MTLGAADIERRARRVLQTRPAVWVLPLAALLAGCGAQSRKVTLQGLLSRVRGPSERQLVKQMFMSPDADVRRAAIEDLSSRKAGRAEPYLRGYAALADDPSPLVRAAALRALGRGADATYADKVVAGLNDSDATVRWDAAAALDTLVTARAVGQLAYAALNDPSRDVRVASAKALRHHRRGDVVETLLRCLDDRDFAVRHRAGQSLSELTGEPAGTDPDAWREALGRRSELFGEKAQPKRSWWRRLRRSRTPEPPPEEAATTRPAKRGPGRPWWDFFGVTRKRRPQGAATRPAP